MKNRNTSLSYYFFNFFKINKEVKSRKWYWEIGIPALFVALAIILHLFSDIEMDWQGFKESSIDVLGILIGFLISAIAIVVSTDNENMRKIKNAHINSHKTIKGWDKRELTLYDLIVSNIVWCVLVSAISLIVILILPMIFGRYASCPYVWLFLIFYCIVATLSMVLDLFIIFTGDIKTNIDKNKQ